MKKLLILTMILLCSSAYGAHTFTGNICNISSLPDTIRQSDHTAAEWDTVRINGTSMSSGGHGLIFYGTGISKWFIDLGSDTILFGTDNSNRNLGIKLPVGCKTMIVNGGTIIHSPTVDYDLNLSDTTKARSNVCMLVAGNDIKLINVNMIAGGFNGQCIGEYMSTKSGGYNVEILGGDYTSNCNYYANRCQIDAGCILFEKAYDSAYAVANGYSYNIKIHDIKIHGVPHMGIRVDGTIAPYYGVFKIYACTIMVDSRNFLYTTNVGTCASSANPYAIAAQYAGPESEIYNNVITSGDTYNGGRGILLENCTGDSTLGNTSRYCKVHDNYIDIHEGPNTEYPELNVENHAFRIRNDCDYTWIYHNTVINTGDTDRTTNSYARAISALRYTFEGTYGGVYSHLIIENNRFIIRTLTGGVTGYAVCFDAVSMSDPTLIFRYNYLYSPNIVTQFGEFNSGAKEITMYRDTFYIPDTATGGRTFHIGHLSNNWDCHGEIVTDGIYLGKARDTNIIFANNGTLNLTLKRTLGIKVIGADNSPVRDANVWVMNAYGDTVIQGQTNVSGTISGLVSYWFEAYSTPDSLGFNNFTIKTKKNYDSTTVSQTISSTSSSEIVVLLNTEGGNPTVITVNNYVIDSSTTRSFGVLGMPRFQMGCFPDSGDVVIYMMNGFPGVKYDFYVSKNLDSTPRWTAKDSSISYPATHAHISVVNDSLYWWNDGVGTQNMRAYKWDGNNLNSIFNYNWNQGVTSLYAASGVRIGDTAIVVTRGYNQPSAYNLLYRISANKGQTFGDSIWLADWTTVSNRVRILGIPFNNTMAIVADSNDQSIVWWTWNRTTKTFVNDGHAFNRSMYRSYSANVLSDTIRFVASTRDLSGGDSIITAFKTLNGSAWEEHNFASSTVGMTYYPNCIMTHINSSNRLVIFYTKSNWNDEDSLNIYMRYWKPDSTKWSVETKVSTVSGGFRFADLSTAYEVPSSHGDMCYVIYCMNKIIEGTIWNFGVVGKVTFGTEPVQKRLKGITNFQIE